MYKQCELRNRLLKWARSSFVPRPLPDFIWRLWRKQIKSGSGLGTRLGKVALKLKVFAAPSSHSTRFELAIRIFPFPPPGCGLSIITGMDYWNGLTDLICTKSHFYGL